MIKASLVYPPPGEVNVTPQTEIIVIFDEGFIHDVNILVDGEIAVKDGRTSNSFATLNSMRHHGKIVWTLRRVGGLPNKDILVKAWTSERCRTIEQRFFVSGSEHTESFKPTQNKKNWCFTRSGVYFSQNTPFRDSIDLESFMIPEKYKENSNFIDIGMRRDGVWRAILCQDEKTILLGDKVFQKYNFSSEFGVICHDMVNIVTEGSTLHLPLNYVPSALENDFCDWFAMKRHKENVKFGNNLHVFWDKDELITRQNPSPWSNSADEMLWTKKDLKTEINKVEIINENVITVNDFVVIEVNVPKVVKI